MVICFAGCAFLSYVLNERSQSAFKAPLASQQEVIRIGIFQLYPDYQKLNESLETMCSSNTDLISIKAIPDFQFSKVKDKLRLCGYLFHHCKSEKNRDIYQEAVFSKQAIANIDTLYLPKIVQKGHQFSQIPSESHPVPPSGFQADELKILKLELVNNQRDQQPLGVIQTYQLIHQAPAIHDKKSPKKL